MAEYPSLDDKQKNLMEESDEEECLDWGPPPEEEAHDIEKLASSSSGNLRDEDKGDGSLCVAVCTLLAAVPALIGSWCWPILVGAIFAVAAGQVNGGLVKFFHGVQVAIMFALMTNIVQFAYWNVQKKRKQSKSKGRGHWFQYQPVYLLMLSTILVLIQPTCMLIIGSWICDGTFSADQLADGVSFNGTDWINLDGSYAGFFANNGTFVTDTANAGDVAIVEGTYYSDGCDPDMKNFFFDGGANSNALVPNTTTGWMIQIFGTYLGFITMFTGVCQATMLHKKIADKWNEIRRLA